MKKRGKTVLLTSHLLGQVQEVCDRVGIMARGEMVREGGLDELTAIERQTEFVVEDAPAGLREEIEKLVRESGARFVVARRPQRDLEGVFLESTTPKE